MIYHFIESFRKGQSGNMQQSSKKISKLLYIVFDIVTIVQSDIDIRLQPGSTDLFQNSIAPLYKI